MGGASVMARVRVRGRAGARVGWRMPSAMARVRVRVRAGAWVGWRFCYG